MCESAVVRMKRPADLRLLVEQAGHHGLDCLTPW